MIRQTMTVILLAISLTMGGVSVVVAEVKPGPLILIGDVLRHNQDAIWKRIYELSGGDMADIVVLATANPRPKLYGGFAVRALQRYGVFVDLVPVAIEREEFGVEMQQAVYDSAIVSRVGDANAVFFVGGAPQRLASALYNTDGSATPLADAIRDLHANGGAIVGGVPANIGVTTDIDGFDALSKGGFTKQDFYQGFGFLDDNWYIDQHFFNAGQFANSLVAMNQLKKIYALGIGSNTAAIINANQLEVVGDSGVMLVDLSQASSVAGSNGFSLQRARLSYLDQGDRLDMNTLNVTPHSYKLDEFEVEPGNNSKPGRDEKFVITDIFSKGTLLRLMIEALEGGQEQVEGIALNRVSGQHSAGFVFRFYNGSDSIGWLSTMFGGQRWTVLNIYLDIFPFDSKQVVRNG